MEKVSYSKVFLTPRDTNTRKSVDWDGLVDQVFKEEVNHFIVETGIQTLKLKDQTNSWCGRQENIIGQSCSSSPSSLPSSSSSFMTSLHSSSHTRPVANSWKTDLKSVSS